MAKRIDGKALAAQIVSDASKEAEALKKRGFTPSLGVIAAGNDPRSISYIKGKKKDCEKAGIGFFLQKLSEKAKEGEIVRAVKKYNEDPAISAFIVQLPLPKGTDPISILSEIDEEKDADGLCPKSIARLEAGSPKTCPCTAMAVHEILESEGVRVEGKKVCVIGRGMTSGRPIANFLSYRNATVTLAHSHTENLKNFTSASDVVISCIGKAHLITPDFISEGAVLIDVGISALNGHLYGDFDPGCFEKASLYTPVPGGVGPMTRAMLLKNSLALSRKIGIS